MEYPSAAGDLLQEEQQRVDVARKDRECRERRKNFALMFAPIVLTLTVATVLAGLGADGNAWL